MSQAKIMCGCGCGRWVYPSQLTDVRIEDALDTEMRQTRKRRILVTRACKKPYEEELGLVKCLQVIVQRWGSNPPKTFWQKANFLRTLDQYWMRVGGAFKVLRLQHAIYERPKGFDYARRHAMRSAILLGCPRIMQGFLAKRFRRQWERDNVPTPLEKDPIKA